MTLKRFLLPPLDSAGRKEALKKLLIHEHRRHGARESTTTGWITDVYPNERGWCEQPGNTDPKQRVYYAIVSTSTQPKDKAQ